MKSSAKMGTTYESLWWSVELPPGWTAFTEGECTTLRATPPLGALQISSARKASGPIEESDLKEFAKERVGNHSPLSPAAYGAFSGFTAVHTDDRLFWKEWWLRSGHLMLYVTYNVAKEYRNAETAYAEAILRSAKPK